jgi:hypothetical protein
MKNVIYFPYISVPENQWFTSTLLYYDKIYSIVPSAFQTHSIMTKSYTKELIYEHLLDPIAPIDYTSMIPQFSKKFLDLVVNSNNSEKVNEKNFKLCEKIHFEKLGEIAEILVEKKLAFKPPKENSWYYVEPNTAHIFMLYLAKSLGEISSISATPITDSYSNARMIAFNNITPTEKIKIENAIRAVLLREILPVPINTIDLRELKSFKVDNQDELVNFRDHIEKEISGLSLIEDKNLRNKEINIFLNNENDQINSIVKKMKDNRWKVTLGSVAQFAPSTLMFIHSLWNKDIIESTAAATDLFLKASKIRKDKQLPSDIAYAIILRDSLKI